ncbi:MAG: hypothetical protein NZ484_00805 [Patescibacteria group bacterium]|nr:hypothetical protein [Patescibacteria group bacterium]MCX7589560.1 hypothetical protein [Patescibacteria group bacterium]MDW8279758.1 hypothetical protein [bacterium]
MPLPEKIIDELSKEKFGTPGWSWKIFMFSVFVLIITISFYLGLNFGYKPYLNSKINELDKQKQQILQSISENDQNKLMIFYSQIANIFDLLKNKKNISQIFSWLEKNTLPDVIFNKFNFNKAGNQINLGGFSLSRESALNQILVFQQSPDVNNIVLNNLNSNSAGQNQIEVWQFDATIYLKESFFNYNR